MFKSAKAHLLAAYRAIQDEEPAHELEARRQEFVAEFPPDVLARLRGQELLEFVHGPQSREGLFYQLEYGNLGLGFGNVWGGSALKYKVYRDGEDGSWQRKSHGNTHVRCNTPKAIQITEWLADSLSRALKAATKLKLENGERAAWEDFERRIETGDGPLPWPDDGYNAPIPLLGWAHKYLALVRPDLFSFHHKPEGLAQHLVRLGEKPESGRYLLDWQWRQLRLADAELRQCDPVGLMHAAYSEAGFGFGVRYWRVGTDELNVDRWPAMRSESIASVGWAKLGNLSEALEGMGESEARARLVELLDSNYPDHKANTHSRWARQIYAFYAKMSVGDRIVAMKGRQLLGVGVIESDYFYVSGDLQPNQHKVRWREVIPAQKWENSPGFLTTIHDFTDDYASALHVEQFVADQPIIITPPLVPDEIPLTPLEQRISDVLERKGQVILFGPPGTGKTYHARRTARELLARELSTGGTGRSWAQLAPAEQNQMDERITFCTFHPAYTYEEFIEGYRPVVTEQGASFERRDGLFLEACEKASATQGHHILIIDEINRGSVAAVLGELLTLLEADKRETLKVRLPLSRREFSVPRNLWIIGTMNTADRSISLLDAALRRRFGFVELMPEPLHLEGKIGELNLASLLSVLNRRVRQSIARNARELQIGHAYFLHEGKPLVNKRQLHHVMRDDVIPLLSEYCFENVETLREILGKTIVDVEEGGLKNEVMDNEEKLYTALCEIVNGDPEGSPTPQQEGNGEDEDAADTN